MPGPFFRWLDTVWGRRAVRTPEGYPGDFTLGWLGCLGYELKRETGGTDVAAATPDAALIFAGRAVVLDHAEGTAWLLALEAPDADGWLDAARSTVLAAAVTSDGQRRQQPSTSAGAALPAAAPPSYVPRRRSRSRDTEPAYKHKIAAAQHEIGDGNSYEVCLTTTLSARAARGGGGTRGARTWPCAGGTRRRSPATCGSAG